jgi:hypothetical protein
MDRRKFIQTAGIALGALALPPVAHERLSAPVETTEQVKYHAPINWANDTLTPRSGYTSDLFFAPADDTEFWIVDGLRVGDILNIEGERILIVGVNDGVSYNVVRGYFGTYAETHIGETFYRIVGIARI